MILNRFIYSELSPEEVNNLGRNRNKHMSSRPELLLKVENLLLELREKGESAILRMTRDFDGIDLQKLWIDKTEIKAIAPEISYDEAQAIQIAYTNIERYHREQLKASSKIQTSPGINCWRESRAIPCAGLYVPGGSAVLPSTFLMLGIPARIAGVPEIVVCSPPQKSGTVINRFIAYVATLLNIDRIYTIGGVQAIAAMGFGLAGIPQVDKLFGPGNGYVTAAKQLIQQLALVSIDMPAGPSEVLIIADEHSNPAFAAADLLAQAEHGPDSQVILLSTSSHFLNKVNEELMIQLPLLPRAEIASQALKNSFSMLTSTLEEAFSFSNQYAPEHLILLLERYEPWIPEIQSAGSVFLGSWAPESAGDYATGTNHTLPTSGYARMYSGLSVDSFQKQISFQHLNPLGLQHIGPTVEKLASIEGLEAHAEAVRIRLKALKNL